MSRLIFCSMALLSMLWDFMLLTTLLYHHIMIEKGDFHSLYTFRLIDPSVGPSVCLS